MRILICIVGLLLGATVSAQNSATLNAHAGPSDNGSTGVTMFFDLQANTDLTITGLRTASVAMANTTFPVTLYTRAGTALGGPVTAGPGSSPDGWSELGTATVTQAATGEISLPFAIPPIPIGAGQTVGVAMTFPPDMTARYFGTGTPAILQFTDSTLTLSSGEARSTPFTPTGTFFSSRSLVGSIQYRLAQPVLAAHPGPDNNGGAVGSGMFFNLTSASGAVVSGLTTKTTAVVNGEVEIDVYTRNDSALGNSTGSGPATSSSGWTLRSSLTGVQGESGTLPIQLPELTVPAGGTLGVGLVYRNVGPRYFGIGSAPLEVFGNTDLTLVTGDAIAVPFTTTAQVFSSRALVGSLYWRPLGHYMNIHPGPTDNGNNPGTALFFDVTGPSDALIKGFRVATSAAFNSTHQVRVHTRIGTALGGSVTSGPGSSPAGWTLHATVNVTQGPSGELTLPFTIPGISLSAGQIRGIALEFIGASPRYRGVGVTPPTTYPGQLQVTSGEARSIPFTTTGTYFVSRELVGTIYFDRGDELFRNGFQ